jgi:uncharacterized membrane protein YkvA (DUF1232 family)
MPLHRRRHPALPTGDRTVSLRISFDLDDDDLKHLRRLMRHSRAAQPDPEAVIAAARALIARVRQVDPPAFMRERLEKLEYLTGMVEDSDWPLPAGEREQILTSLGYLINSEDLIPDSLPGLGFLDDAILIELVVRELHHEIAAYEEFCAFRKSRHDDEAVTRQNWLEAKRKMLQERMRRRHDAMRRRRHRGWRLFG